MSQNSEKYYLFSEDWSMDPNQWSMVLDSTAVLLTVFGVLIGFFLYRKQRRDNSKDAFEFFQSSLPELIQSIESAIADLKEFNLSLDLDNFVNPIISASLNDKFLTKINIVHLNRYYTQSREGKLSNFKQLLVDSNFFGDYHAYISKEINSFRTNYEEKKSTYSKWRLLRSKQFFSQITETHESAAYQEFYTNWVSDLNQNLSDNELIDEDKSSKLKRREVLVKEEMQRLAENIPLFVSNNQNANEARFLAHQVISADREITEMKTKIRRVLEKDISRFEKVLSNMSTLLE